MSRFSRFATVLTVALVVFAVAVPAFGAPASWQVVDVISHQEQSNSVLLVSGTLPESTTLPAEVSLSVPQGAQLQWAGEVFGGDPSKDIEATPAKTTQDGADVYTFTLTKARVGQVEIITPAVAFDGQAYTPSLTWVATQAVPEVRMSARIPAGSTIARPAEGAALEPGPEGYSYYTARFTDVKPGDTPSLAFAYSAAPAAAAPAAAGGGAADNTALLIVVLVVVVAAGAALAVSVSRKMASRSGAGDDDDEVVDTRGDRSAPSVQPSAEESTDEPAPRRVRPAVLMVTGLVLVVAVAFVMVGQSSKPQLVNGTLTRAFGGVGACTSTTLALTPAQGVDLARDGDKLIDSLAGIESIGLVTLHVDRSEMTVEFCDSSTNDGAIRNALASTGLVSW